MDTLLDSIIIEPPKKASAAIIWLHGLGADGHDFSAIVPSLNLPENHSLRFIFPHAPKRPVTINQGMIMPAWYDIKPNLNEEDTVGIQQAQQQLNNLINYQEQQGIPPNRIILAGFSQGGAVALHTGLRYEKPLQGIMALSTYLPLASNITELQSSENKNIPIFYAHGQQDQTIPLYFALMSKEKLQSIGCQVQWHAYPMGHEVSTDEINHISTWLKQKLVL